MSLTVQETATLLADAALDEPLRRVAYEAGMLLGLEATQDEQAYHRRRLTRHQYWLQGAGVVAGLRVRVETSAAPNPRVRLLVGPGVAIDGLGREVLVTETHCLDLADWLAAQGPSTLADGFDDTANRLRLRVTVRYQDCPLAAQPVLARQLNLGTDPVAASRIADAVALEIAVEPPAAALAPAPFRPWPLHGALDADLPELPAEESAALAAADAVSPQAGARLRMHLRLLHLFDGGDWGPPEALSDLLPEVRLPLARVAIEAADQAALAALPGTLTAAGVSVDNLARPFLPTAAQLAFLGGG